MTTVTKIIEWDMGHRVPNHKSKCRNMHGHRYRAEIAITGPLIEESGSSSEGMVIDFGDIKEIIKTNIHDVLDHGFMVYENDELLIPLLDDLAKVHQMLLIKVPFIPTAENIVYWCFLQIKDKLPKQVYVDNIRLYETPNSWVDFHPEKS